MSIGSTQQRKLLEAAYLLDFRTLSRLDDPGASAAIRTFNLIISEPPAVDEETPLSIAMSGLYLELTGDRTGALDLYRSLARSDDELVRLFGASLQAWSVDATADDYERVRASALNQSIPYRIRMSALTKICAWNWEAGNFDAAARAWQEAHAYARGDFRKALTRVSQWFTGRYDDNYEFIQDSVISQPQLDSLVAESAAKELEKQVLAAAASPWRRSRSWSAVPHQSARAAELQASWTGSLWLFPQVKRHLATVLLAERPMNAPSVQDGVTNWIAGAGSNCREIVRQYEPWFDRDTATSIYEKMDGLGPYFVSPHDRWGVLRELWDELSPSVSVALIQSIPVQPIDPQVGQPMWPEANDLLALLYLVAPTEWLTRFATLAAVERVALSLSLTTGVVQALPSRVLQQMAVDNLDLIEAGEANDSMWFVVNELLSHSSDDSAAALVKRFSRSLDSAPLNVQGGLTASPFMTAELGRAVVEGLSNRVRDALHEGQRGRFTMASQDPYVMLGQAIADGAAGDADAVAKLLRSIVNSEYMPAEAKHGAGLGLQKMSRGGYLTAEFVREIARTPRSETVDSHWSEDSDTEARLLTLRRRLIRLATIPSSTEDIALASAAVRDPAVRVRIVAVEGLVMARTSAPEAGPAYLSALYDPQSEVRFWGLQALLDDLISGFNQRELALERVRHLWPDSPRPVRVLLTRIAQKEKLRGILELAKSDRSWQIRESMRATT